MELVVEIRGVEWESGPDVGSVALNFGVCEIRYPNKPGRSDFPVGFFFFGARA